MKKATRGSKSTKKDPVRSKIEDEDSSEEEEQAAPQKMSGFDFDNF